MTSMEAADMTNVTPFSSNLQDFLYQEISKVSTLMMGDVLKSSSHSLHKLAGSVSGLAIKGAA